MDPFLDRFYDDVDDSLGDPHSQKRFTKADRYKLLYSVQKNIFESLMAASGLESEFCYSEATITIQDGVARYTLPENFRQFIEFKYYDSDGNLAGRYETIGVFSNRAGVRILDGNRGMLIQPTPDVDADQEWTLYYYKGPVKLHYATLPTYTEGDAGTDPCIYDPSTEQALTGYTVTTTKVELADRFTANLLGESVEFFNAGGTSIGSATITTATSDKIEFAAVTGLADTCSMIIDLDWCWMRVGTPGTDAGELVTYPDYYNGSMVRIYDATTGAPQVKEVTDYYSEDSTWVMILRHPLVVVPTGTVKYEIMPDLPEGLDEIYGMDVAIRGTTRRSSFKRRQGLKGDRLEKWKSCLAFVASMTMDRAPRRIHNRRPSAINPYRGGDGW
jgi:hypothetical protein